VIGDVTGLAHAFKIDIFFRRKSFGVEATRDCRDGIFLENGTLGRGSHR
jgi:hypothetical protein